MDEQQAHFEGWARVEVMGHQTHIGYVRTEAYGAAVMFRVDAPELPERQYVLESPEYVGGDWMPKGATVQRAAVKGHTVLVGAGSIYRILPCTEAAALKAIETTGRAELKVISLPEGKQLPAYEGDDDEEKDDDDYDNGAVPLPVGVRLPDDDDDEGGGL